MSRPMARGKWNFLVEIHAGWSQIVFLAMWLINSVFSINYTLFTRNYVCVFIHHSIFRSKSVVGQRGHMCIYIYIYTYIYIYIYLYIFIYTPLSLSLSLFLSLSLSLSLSFFLYIYIYILIEM